MTIELYRYRAQGDHDYMDLKILLDKFPVIKETKAGFWIDIHSLKYLKGKPNIQTKKWVPKDTDRGFAHSTEAKAMIKFAFRKKTQIRILKSQLAQAKAERDKINEMLTKANIVLSPKLKIY